MSMNPAAYDGFEQHPQPAPPARIGNSERRVMIVWARQRRTLEGIEKDLAASEPHLKAMFTIFGKLTQHESPGGAEPLTRRRGPHQLAAASRPDVDKG